MFFIIEFDPFLLEILIERLFTHVVIMEFDRIKLLDDLFQLYFEKRVKGSQLMFNQRSASITLKKTLDEFPVTFLKCFRHGCIVILRHWMISSIF